MKLKKVILSVLIILLGLTGSLFGCQVKPLELYTVVDKQEVSKISLYILSSNLGESQTGQEQEDNQTSEEDQTDEKTDKKTIFVCAKNANDMFNKGLDISFSEANIVSCTLNKAETEKAEDAYAFDIVAYRAKNVIITFETKDKKTKTVLEVEVLQDCEKIEKNIHSENFVIKGENKQLSSTIVNFYPTTTTNKNLKFKLRQDYEGKGITLSEDGFLSFDENFDASLTEFYVNITHENHETAGDNAGNFVVEDIKFDILSPVEDIVAIDSQTDPNGNFAKISSLEFATNLEGTNFNFRTIAIKKLLKDNSIENIGDSFKIEYYLKNEAEKLVSIEEVENFELTISQNGRDGQDTLVVKVVNLLYPSYFSNEYEINIVVKTYPNYITINGQKNFDEVALYDNGLSKELEIKVSESYNTNFKILSIQSDKISLKYKNGVSVQSTDIIESGTTLVLSCAEYIDFGTQNEISTQFQIISEGNDNLNVWIKVRIIKNLVDAEIYDADDNNQNDISGNDITLYKTDVSGNSTIKKYVVKSTGNVIIPDFDINVENPNVVKLESINKQEKSFSLKALTTGESLITVVFDNGLQKYFNINVYTAIKDVEVLFSDYSKTYNIGNIEQTTVENKTLTKYSIKNGTNSQLLFEAKDINGNIVYDKYVISAEYILTYSDNQQENYIAVSSADNKLYALKTTPSNEYVKVTCNITAYVYNDGNYELKTKTKEFLVEVYEPIKNIILSDEYITLYTQDSLGYEDYDKATKEITLTILPASATKIDYKNLIDKTGNEYKNIRKNFNEANVEFTPQINEKGLKLTITATKFSDNSNKQTETGTITFSIQEFNFVYTKRVTVKVMKAQSPEGISVENVSQQTNNEGKIVDYLYFNLGYDNEGIKINPKVYPISCLNTDYIFKIVSESENQDDIISFDRNENTVKPLKAGKCKLILMPKGSIKNPDEILSWKEGKIKEEKIIEIVVGDGESVPYRISSKNELMNLCEETVINEDDENDFVNRLNKNYVLTNDIDLSFETVVPIGVYTLKIKSGNLERKVKEFTGSLNGKFEIGGISNNYSINGISLKINSSYKSSLINNNMYLGLVAQNKGKILNLTLNYSSVQAIVSRYANPANYQSENQKLALYFGGISAQNNGLIENCEVNLNNFNIETYFGNNFVGAIAGLNESEINEKSEVVNKAQIKNCYALGNMNIVDGYANILNKNSAVSILFGGLAGQNAEKSEILGDFKIYNNNSEIFNKNIMNVTLNLSSIVDGSLAKLANNSAFGLACGQNNGIIKNISSYGKIFASLNAGGICGINNGTVGGEKEDGCFSASLISGGINVGGLIGQNGENGITKYNAVMLLDDNEFLEENSKTYKIIGNEFVGGLIGKINEKNTANNFENNFVRSYVKKYDKYFDIGVKKDNFGPLWTGDNLKDSQDCVINSNFADNLLIEFGESQSNKLFKGNIKGDIENIGIDAPDKIEVKINNSTLTGEEMLYSYNKFIKANDNTIVLYYYKNSDYAKYNYYLQNLLFKISYTKKNGNNYDGIPFTKIESLTPDILTVDAKGNFVVNKTGDAKLLIYSALNKDASQEIAIKVVDLIENFGVFEDGLLDKKIETIYVEKGTSKNVYLSESVVQEDLFVKYTITGNSGKVIEINTNDSEYYSVLNGQVFKGFERGNVVVKAELFVKINGKYYKILGEYSFNVVVIEGLKEFSTSIERAELASTSFVNFEATAVTDLASNTNIAVKQKVELDEKWEDGEYLDFEFEKVIASYGFKLLFKVKPSLNKELLKQIYGKTILFDIYLYDDLVSLKDIEQNPEKYDNYKKTIEFIINENGVINAEMQYFADGEVVKNEDGQDVINTNELESEFIKIGKIGILKINLYPKEILAKENSVVLTYQNSDNYNLNFQQVEKTSDGYQDVNTSKLTTNGIILDNQYLTSDPNEQYLYVKLLTDSPIKEDSKFVLNLNISGFDYEFEKVLTSTLASNLEIAFDGAVLNAQGSLEGVYAKGASTSQIITLTVNRLTDYVPNVVVDVSNLNQANFVEILPVEDPVMIGKNSKRYSYIINGLNYSGENESVELYFFIEKTVNGKIEKYNSNKLKLNVTDFVVKDISVEKVENGYLTKPFGTSYPLKVSLGTINNGSVEVLNLINAFEEDLAKSSTVANGKIVSNIFVYNNQKLYAGMETTNFKIEKNNYFEINPNVASRTSGFVADFAISYNYSDGNDYYPVKLIKDYKNQNDIFINGNLYSVRFVQNFGTDFYIQNDINNPIPVYSSEEFVNMEQNGNYILMNDIVLAQNTDVELLKNGYTPFVANFDSLDGNGYKVIIKNLNVDLSNTLEEYNFGLFSEVSENCLIKNLTVKFDLQNISTESNFVEDYNILNFENVSSLTFGSICAVNKGLIYNCFVESLKNGYQEDLFYVVVQNIVNDAQTRAVIGGFVGKNEGIITNSRTELKLCASKGFVGGFAGENNGTISSCYFKNVIVKNLGEDENTSSLAGFVHNNTGTIKFSFVEGDSRFVDSGRYLCNTTLSNYALTAPTSVGGFVFNNSGNIEDCYSNLSLTSQSYSGGFAFTNSGKILRCYAATLNEKENNIAHAPFIATKVQIDEEFMKTNVKDCFYLNINKTLVNDAYCKGLSLENMNDEYYLTNFIFDGNDSVWAFRGQNLLPTLVEATNVAVSKRSLYSVTESPNGGILYSYVYNNNCYAGSKINPIIVSNEEEFIEYFTSQNKTNSQYYRLINNINFSDYAVIPTYNYTFSGRFDGNGLEISNVRISAPSNYSGDSFGLFAKIEKYKNGETPIVKNINIKPLEVYANNASFVGTLAGIVKDANIVNINVDAQDVIVQGRNIVGGVVGLLCGNSNMVNVSSNVSANSNFSSSATSGYYLYYSNNGEAQNANSVSYAGSICGVVDTEKTSTNNETSRNIEVKVGTKSIAWFAGLAFGLVCEDSGIDNVKVYVNNSSYINSTYAGGYICGENRGYISRAETINEGYGGASLFKNNCKFAGGIVGFNNNGTIVNSLSNVAVIGNSKTIVAGGIVGVSVGGAISSCVATNSVYASSVVGGICGMTARREMFTTSNQQFRILNLFENDNALSSSAIKTNNIMYIANCVAINNFNDDVLSYLDSNNEGHYVGAIIGAVQNTQNNESGTIDVAKKISYITYENYYKKQSYKKDGETFDLQDYAVNNISDFDVGTQSKNTKSENSCAEAFDSLKSNMFSNFSKSVFDFDGEISESNLPKLKSANNINTKKLEGSGTYADPYRINSVRAINELSSLVENGATDVYVNVTENIEATGKEFNSIGSSVHKFNGTFNGNNYFINGLTYFNVDKYNTKNYFGLFGYVSNLSTIRNLNVVANFVINFVQPQNNNSSITSTGIIAGYNEGYIANCNTYGGMICSLKDSSNKMSIAYVGAICGINAGQTQAGLLNCKNYATIYISISDVENSNSLKENVSFYAGFISGANLNGAIINKCENLATKNIDLNKGAISGSENYTLIVINKKSSTCKNYVGTLAGFVSDINNVYGDNANHENIYELSYHSIETPTNPTDPTDPTEPTEPTQPTLTLTFDVDSQQLVNDVIYGKKGDVVALPTINAGEYGLTGYIVEYWYLEPTFKTKVEFPYKLTSDTILYGYWTYKPHDSIDEGFYKYLDKFNKHSSSNIITINSREELIGWTEYIMFKDVTESISDEYKIKVTYLNNQTKENWSAEFTTVWDIKRNAEDLFHNSTYWYWCQDYVKIYVKDSDSYINNLAKVNVSTDGDDTTVTSTYSQLNYALEYKASKSREDNYDDFKINNLPSSKEIRVSSSTQLVYALEHGLKPICEAGTTAETVYNKAKAILRSICNDTMSDYQKLYAIYDWLVSNVQYEHGAFGDDINISDWGRYQEWFAEGALINGKAVCDGYSKAAIVLAKIEGIPIIRAIGNKHAWNKVYINGNWYVFDATHGDFVASYSKDGTSYKSEMLSHTEFLTTEEYKISCGYTDVRHTEIECKTKYDFYSNAKFSYGTYNFDLKIDTTNDFNGLINYVNYYSLVNKQFIIEFVVAGSYTLQNVTDKIITLDGYSYYIYFSKKEVNGYTRYSLLLFFS